jgi:hypothetical protein
MRSGVLRSSDGPMVLRELRYDRVLTTLGSYEHDDVLRRSTAVIFLGLQLFRSILQCHRTYLEFTQRSYNFLAPSRYLWYLSWHAGFFLILLVMGSHG